MAKVSTNTQIDTINILNSTSSANDSDLFLLQRGLISYKIQKSNLEFDDSKIQVSSGNLTSTDVDSALEELYQRDEDLDDRIDSLSSSVDNIDFRVIIFEERESTGTNPQNPSTATRGGWKIRKINTKLDTLNAGTGASVNSSSGEFTVPAGKYLVESMCSHQSGGDNRPVHRLYDTISGSTALNINNDAIISGPGNVFGSDGDGNTSHGSTILSSDSSMTFTLEQTGNKTTASSNVSEIYAYVKFQLITD